MRVATDTVDRCPECLACRVWEWANLGTLAPEAYATTALEKGITAAEQRARVLAQVHREHRHG